jgi:type I restriction enzyme M protein
VLNEQYQYPFERMEVEKAVHFGREKKKADIVIYDKNDSLSVYMIVELKRPKLKDGKEQLKSYCNATGAPIGIWTNGDSISYYNRRDPNYFKDIPNIPKATEKLSDILSERWTIKDLVINDKLVNEIVSSSPIPILPTPAATKYCKIGQPNPPAPMINTLASDSFA